MPSNKLRVLPLGGLGEIGKNMTVIEYGGKIIVVDTGLMFPTAEMHGIDLVLPDFTYLRDRADDIEAIVLTHGHEDHVGALPYVIREIGMPPVIYGGMLTIGMVRSKLDEHKLGDKAPLQELPPGEKVTRGPFQLELIHLAHSIPDMRGVLITTDAGNVLMTGDYKFDQTPVDGKPADISRLAELGKEGLTLLCGDSTNADRKGVAPSESSVGPALLQQFSQCKGRIVVTSFASNIHRVQQVIDAAVALDRKVALVGRSMRKNFNIASNLGMARAPQGVFIQPREIEDFPDEKVVVISTGSQGEPLSALRRMANNDHRDVSLHSGDTIVFSASPVPGNERAVNETIDRIYEIGATVITAKDAPIHASGHGFQEEMKLMLNLTKPRFMMPVHGDFQRIRLHSELAEAVGIEPKNIFKGHNGLPLEVGPDGAALRRGHQSRDDVRRRSRHRRPRRCRPPRPPRDLRRRHLHRRHHDLLRRRLDRRRPRGDLPRRRLPRRRQCPGRRHLRPGRRHGRGGGEEGRHRPRGAPGRGRPARGDRQVRLAAVETAADGRSGGCRGLIARGTEVCR